MSKSNINSKNIPQKGQLRCLFLYGTTSSGASLVKPHTHPYWQMEIARQGTFTAWAEKRKFILQPGEAIMLPPGTTHTFEYPEKDIGFISLKFEITGLLTLPPAGILAANRQNIVLHETVVKLVGESGVPSPAFALVLGHLLDAYMEQFTGTPKPGQGETVAPLMEKIREVIFSSGGRPLTLARLSQELGLSAGHISNYFRKKQGVSIKSFVDQKRAEAALRLLQYSDQNAKEIADRMGFTDQYTFSHFCKRTLGKSPRELRIWFK